MSKLREQRIEMLKEMAEKTGGMITTSQIEKAGISRVLIPTFIDEGILVKEARGIYYYAADPQRYRVAPIIVDISKSILKGIAQRRYIVTPENVELG